ncbi:hypothetical protein TYRP_015307 [Tyrophagus putrescentiae]|nr:hypothetical protein TYRP_015307 [Tyrophagus putrescentiae]
MIAGVRDFEAFGVVVATGAGVASKYGVLPLHLAALELEDCQAPLFLLPTPFLLLLTGVAGVQEAADAAGEQTEPENAQQSVDDQGDGGSSRGSGGGDGSVTILAEVVCIGGF